MAFYPLSDLLELHLNDNSKLAELQGFAFDGLFALEKCILSNNPRLSRVDRKAFPPKGLFSALNSVTLIFLLYVTNINLLLLKMRIDFVPMHRETDANRRSSTQPGEHTNESPFPLQTLSSYPASLLFK